MSFENSVVDRMWADLADVGGDPSTGGYRRYAWTSVDGTVWEGGTWTGGTWTGGTWTGGTWTGGTWTGGTWRATRW